MTDKIKEYPILFKAPMVKAILDDKKTMTRRLVKLREGETIDASTCWAVHPLQGSRLLRCPYGKKGERLWLKETALPDFPKEFSYYDWSWREVPEEYRKPEFVLYRASYPHPDKLKWHPSIFMPRWASRITLENTGIRIERVQDISERDILAEGVTVDLVAEWCKVPWSDMPTLHDAWRAAWIHINGPESWERNDSVWAISFRRIQEGAE